MSAAGTLVQMASHGGGATTLDGVEDLEMQPSEPRGRLIGESVPGSGDDVGQLQEWPRHSILRAVVFRLGERERVERAGRSF